MAENQGLKWLIGADARDFKKGMAEAQKASRQFKAEAGKAFDEFASAFGVDMSKIRQSIDTFKNAVKTMTGANTAAAGSAGVLTKAMKLLKVALIGTGIGALIVALGTLVTYFTRTERGADKLAKAMAGVKAVFDVLIDRASAFGEGVYKIFTGDFKGGWDALKNSLSGIGTEMVTEAKQASKLEEELDDLYDRETALLEVQAERNKQVAELRRNSENQTISEAQRAEMLRKAMELERKTLEENLELQRERARIVTEQVGMGESMAEDERRAAEERAKLAQMEANFLNETRRMYSRESSLTKAALKEETEAVKEQAQTYRELRQAQQEQFDAEIEMRKQLLPTVGEQTPGVSMALAPMTILTPEQIAELQGQADAMKGVVLDLTSEINNAMNGMAVGFGEAIGNMIAGTAGFSDIGSLILGPLADMAIQVGKIAIGSGIAIEGIKKAFASLNPGVAIAAGVALVALGTAVKGALAKAAQGGGANYSTGGSYTGRGLQTSANISAQAQPQKIEIIGETTIKNRDIYVAFKAAEQQRKLNT